MYSFPTLFCLFQATALHSNLLHLVQLIHPRCQIFKSSCLNVLMFHVPMLKLISLLVILLEVVPTLKSKCGTILILVYCTSGRTIIYSIILFRENNNVVVFPYLHPIGQLVAHPPSRTLSYPKDKKLPFPLHAHPPS